MTLFEFLVLLFVAGICGAVGQSIAGFSRGGCLVAVGIGFVGAVLGMWLARLMSLPALFTLDLGGTAFPVVWAILGSSLFVALISLVRRGR